MPGASFSLSNPIYWVCGLAIFAVGVWTGRVVALRLVPPGSWRQVAGTALIFAGTLALSSRAQPAPALAPAAINVSAPRTSVVIAHVGLAAQTMLTSDNVELRDVSVDAVQPNALTALSDAIGKVLNVPVVAGEQIVSFRLANRDSGSSRPNPGGVMIPGVSVAPTPGAAPGGQVCPSGPVLVIVDAANVRSGASIASSVIDQVKYGTSLQVVDRSADWLEVSLPDQRVGWVAAGWVTPCYAAG